MFHAWLFHEDAAWGPSPQPPVCCNPPHLPVVIEPSSALTSSSSTRLQTLILLADCPRYDKRSDILVTARAR
ncbi:Hypp6468 [Branchiostoma lanceolatum]|uniref:Hypp6468 protein n=1 Tax=Branchiostoma lanceolatum TaxID=7740 RepID=A0A8K0EAQ4_BRALA|nr:Hypp6468 [Branchiostoma lanceolatum]